MAGNATTMPELSTAPVLEEWFSVRHHGGNGHCLFGTVTGHSRLPDGEHIQTSPVLEQGKGWARTRNTLYRLGEPITLEALDRVLGTPRR